MRADPIATPGGAFGSPSRRSQFPPKWRKTNADADFVLLADTRAGRYMDRMRYQRAELPLKLDGLKAAQSFFQDCIDHSDPSRESVWVAHVDEQANCLHFSRHDGQETGADFPIRFIIADAARHRSAGIIIAHNHPGGDPRPSDSDCRATRRLVTAAEALDCTIVDHLVFAGDSCTSFRNLGLL